MDTIEYADSVNTACDCCGAAMTRLTRFVSRGGEPFAIYRALLPFGVHNRRADVMVSIGAWAEATPPAKRLSFAVHLTADEANFNIAFVEPDQTSWSSGELGRILSRHEALEHPWKQEVLALIDHMLESDKPLGAYLSF